MTQATATLAQYDEGDDAVCYKPARLKLRMADNIYPKHAGPTAMSFAVLRNTHEAFRMAIQEMQEVLLSDGPEQQVVDAWVKHWRRFLAALGLHMKMEDEGMFVFLENKIMSEFLSEGLGDEHEVALSLEHDIEVALQTGSLSAIREAYEIWRVDHLDHLEHEEDIMMPQSRRAGNSQAERSQVFHDRVLTPTGDISVLVTYVVQKLTQFGSTAQKAPIAVRVFAHGLQAASTPTQWDRYLPLVREATTPEIYELLVGIGIEDPGWITEPEHDYYFECTEALPNLARYGMDEMTLMRSLMALQVDRLRNLPIFVLDNSVRETTVAALKGHTLQDKLDIYEQVQTVGFQHFILGTFIHNKRVDDQFVEELHKRGKSFNTLYAFTEKAEVYGDVDPVSGLGIPLFNPVPVGQMKMRELRIPNKILEIDVCCRRTDFTRFSYGDYHELCGKRLAYARGKSWVNIRDFTTAMLEAPDEVLRFVAYFSLLPLELRPLGLIIEDPTGGTMPQIMALWASAVRRVMDAEGWPDGHFLVHAHYNFGLGEAMVQSFLAAGGTGIWCAVCREGAATGHASSLVTLTNLARLGNKHVTRLYNMPALRRAAIEVTRIVTGRLPHDDEEVYGSRSAQVVFDSTSMGGGSDFDIFEFFESARVTRITTMAGAPMFQDRFMEITGGSTMTLEQAELMKGKLTEELTQGKKLNYTSPVGFIGLYKRCGLPTSEAVENLCDEIQNMDETNEPLLLELRYSWRRECCDDSASPHLLTYEEFYASPIIAGQLSCSFCQDTIDMFRLLDPDDCHHVHWEEYLRVSKDALAQFRGEVQTVQDLVGCVFNHYLRAELNELKSAHKTVDMLHDELGAVPSATDLGTHDWDPERMNEDNIPDLKDYGVDPLMHSSKFQTVASDDATDAVYISAICRRSIWQAISGLDGEGRGGMMGGSSVQDTDARVEEDDDDSSEDIVYRMEI